MSKLSQNEIDALFSRFGNGEEEPAAAPTPQPAAFPTLEPAPPEEVRPSSIGLLGAVELDVTVRLGRTRRSIRELLQLGAGSVLQLDNLAGETVDILVNGHLLARGEVVIVGENYGVRIVELVQVTPGVIS
ncbi:MAG TPA: flagellar motor switch protein FliN [Symbiobacteriaceae bacterium]|jgi:flagellar motor switch protein FliN|nr:flagellar motor switch protein FliN [Symbiobacteriaceae bacterium]